MKPKANELVAGIFVILMVVAFLIFLSWSSGGIDRWFAVKRPAVTWFSNVSGLKENVQVVYQGLPIGDVDLVDYDTSLKLIRVHMLLKADFVDSELPPRVVAQITTSSLLGDPYIELTADYSYIDTAYLVRGDDRVVRTEDGVLLIDSLDPIGWGTIQVQASRLITDIQGRFSTMSDTIGRILTGTEELLADRQFREDVHATASYARTAAAGLPATIANANATMASANSAVTRVDSMIARSEDTIVRIVENADEIAINTRALTYTLSERPSRLVWDDKERQRRLAEGDTSIIFGTWRNLGARSSGADSGPRAAHHRPAPRRMGTWANPNLAPN